MNSISVTAIPTCTNIADISSSGLYCAFVSAIESTLLHAAVDPVNSLQPAMPRPNPTLSPSQRCLGLLIPMIYRLTYPLASHADVYIATFKCTACQRCIPLTLSGNLTLSSTSAPFSSTSSQLSASELIPLLHLPSSLASSIGLDVLITPSSPQILREGLARVLSGLVAVHLLSHFKRVSTTASHFLSDAGVASQSLVGTSTSEPCLSITTVAMEAMAMSARLKAMCELPKKGTRKDNSEVKMTNEHDSEEMGSDSDKDPNESLATLNQTVIRAISILMANTAMYEGRLPPVVLMKAIGLDSGQLMEDALEGLNGGISNGTTGRLIGFGMERQAEVSKLKIGVKEKEYEMARHEHDKDDIPQDDSSFPTSKTEAKRAVDEELSSSQPDSDESASVPSFATVINRFTINKTDAAKLRRVRCVVQAHVDKGDGCASGSTSQDTQSDTQRDSHNAFVDLVFPLPIAVKEASSDVLVPANPNKSPATFTSSSSLASPSPLPSSFTPSAQPAGATRGLLCSFCDLFLPTSLLSSTDGYFTSSLLSLTSRDVPSSFQPSPHQTSTQVGMRSLSLIWLSFLQSTQFPSHELKAQTLRMLDIINQYESLEQSEALQANSSSLSSSRHGLALDGVDDVRYAALIHQILSLGTDLQLQLRTRTKRVEGSSHDNYTNVDNKVEMVDTNAAPTRGSDDTKVDLSDDLRHIRRFMTHLWEIPPSEIKQWDHLNRFLQSPNSTPGPSPLSQDTNEKGRLASPSNRTPLFDRIGSGTVPLFAEILPSVRRIDILLDKQRDARALKAMAQFTSGIVDVKKGCLFVEGVPINGDLTGEELVQCVWTGQLADITQQSHQQQRTHGILSRPSTLVSKQGRSEGNMFKVSLRQGPRLVDGEGIYDSQGFLLPFNILNDGVPPNWSIASSLLSPLHTWRLNSLAALAILTESSPQSNLSLVATDAIITTLSLTPWHPLSGPSRLRPWPFSPNLPSSSPTTLSQASLPVSSPFVAYSTGLLSALPIVRCPPQSSPLYRTWLLDPSFALPHPPSLNTLPHLQRYPMEYVCGLDELTTLLRLCYRLYGTPLTRTAVIAMELLTKQAGVLTGSVRFPRQLKDSKTSTANGRSSSSQLKQIPHRIESRAWEMAGKTLESIWNGEQVQDLEHVGVAGTKETLERLVQEGRLALANGGGMITQP